MADKFIVSSSPHIKSPLTTKKIMLHVIIALCFPLLASVFIFGLYSLFIVAISVMGAVLGEWLYNKITKKQATLNDLSAVVTGIILGLNLPSTVPFYLPIVGGLFATMFVKMLFGGLGKNFANPAATARLFLMLSWTSQMTRYASPINYSNAGEFLGGFKNIVSSATYITSATPLAGLKQSVSSDFLTTPLIDLFLGRISGSIGEVCALAIILALIYLLVFKIIDWEIPLFYLLSCIIFTLLFYKDGHKYILTSILSGGLLFAMTFMLTDYATSPLTFLGRIIYAVGAGLLTIFIRRFGSFPEGACFSIVLMNILTPLIDMLIKPKPLGFIKPQKIKAER